MGELYSESSIDGFVASSGDVVYLSDQYTGADTVSAFVLGALINSKKVIIVSKEDKATLIDSLKRNLKSVNSISGVTHEVNFGNLSYVSRLDDALGIIRSEYDADLENTVVFCYTDEHKEGIALRAITLGARLRRYAVVWAVKGSLETEPISVSYVKLKNPLSFGDL